MRRLEPTRLPAMLLALACLTASASGSAQQPVNPVNAEMDKADELYRQGNDAYKQNRLKDAYGFYREAWNRKKSYDIAGNLGAVELAISMPRDAAEHLLHSLKQFPANGKPEARDKTRQRLEEALKQIGTLVIKVNVEGAEILVDGRSIGKAPLEDEVFVEPGARKIEAKMEGYEPARQQLQVTKGASLEVPLKLKKATAPPPVTTSSVRPARSIPIIVAGAAVSAAAIGSGIGLLVASGAKGSEADDKLGNLKRQYGSTPCPGAGTVATQCEELKNLRSDHDTFQNFGVGMFVFGGLVAGATVGYVILSGPKAKTDESEEEGVRAVPVANKDGGGLWLTGTF